MITNIYNTFGLKEEFELSLPINKEELYKKLQTLQSNHSVFTYAFFPLSRMKPGMYNGKVTNNSFKLSFYFGRINNMGSATFIGDYKRLGDQSTQINVLTYPPKFFLFFLPFMAIFLLATVGGKHIWLHSESRTTHTFIHSFSHYFYFNIWILFYKNDEVYSED